jgi:hypothetical protein
MLSHTSQTFYKANECFFRYDRTGMRDSDRIVNGGSFLLEKSEVLRLNACVENLIR